jgi:hypothetical protein
VTGELKLESGREVVLRELQQRSTYEGLLNGLPTREKNQRLLARLKENAHPRYGVAPYIIAPTEQEIVLPEGETYPFGTPASLPRVQCIARFESVTPTAAGAGDASGLVVIWFQEQFQYPPAAEVAAQMKAIRWEVHAGNFEY